MSEQYFVTPTAANLDKHYRYLLDAVLKAHDEKLNLQAKTFSVEMVAAADKERAAAQRLGAFVALYHNRLNVTALDAPDGSEGR